MKISTFQRLTVIATAGVALGAFAPNFASAANVAQFDDINPGLVNFTTTGSSTTISASGLAEELTFDSQTPNSAPSATIATDLTITGTATAPAVSFGPAIFQSFSTLDLTFYTAGTSTPIFTATATGAGFEADGYVGSFSATNVSPSSVSLLSPYVMGSEISSNQAIDFNISSTTPATLNSSDYLNNYSAEIGTGTISAVAAPEISPAYGLAIAGAGLIGLTVLGRRKKVISAK